MVLERSLEVLYFIQYKITCNSQKSGPHPNESSHAVSSQGVAALGHSMVNPMDPKYFEKIDTCLSSPVGAFGEKGMPPSMASHMIPATALPRRL